jgi:hypothetical protein
MAPGGLELSKKSRRERRYLRSRRGLSHAAMVARVGKGKDYRTFRSGASLSQVFSLCTCSFQEEAKCP